MRRLSILFLLLSTIALSSQEKKNLIIEDLHQKVATASGGEKLTLLDSLCRLTRFRGALKYDSIAKKTISLAFELDSLELAVNHMSNLVFYYTNRAGNPVEGMRVFDDFRGRNIQLDNKKLLSQMYTDGGDSYFFSGKRKESIGIYEVAEKMALLAQDSLRYGLARRYKSAAYSDLGNYLEAFKQLTEVVGIFNRTKDTMNIISTRLSIATLYNKIGFLEKAKKERNEIIAIGRRIKHYESLVPNLFNASLEANMIGNQRERIQHLLEAYTYISEPDFRLGIAPIIRYGLLSAYAENDSLSKARTILKEIEKKHLRKAPIPYEDIYRLALADFFYASKAYRRALKEAKWVLDYRKSRYSVMGINNANKRLSKIYDALGDSDNSYKHYVDYITLKDSVNTVKKTLALTYYETLYETEKRDATIAEQESKIIRLDQQNRAKRQWIIFGGIGLLVVFIIIYLYRLGIFAKRKEELQQAFTKNLILERENERTHLARELHDSIGQKMMLLTKKTKSIGDEEMKEIAKTTLEELREISKSLYPATLERLGLSKSIEALIDNVDRKSTIFFTHEIDNIDELVDKDAGIHLYRLVQEALSNMLKHSEAKAASISIRKDANSVKAIIKDNGIGFAVPGKEETISSFGIKTFLERAKILNATVDIKSNRGKGTVIDLVLPV